jgi:hypothetical protein
MKLIEILEKGSPIVVKKQRIYFKATYGKHYLFCLNRDIPAQLLLKPGTEFIKPLQYLGPDLNFYLVLQSGVVVKDYLTEPRAEIDILFDKIVVGNTADFLKLDDQPIVGDIFLDQSVLIEEVNKAYSYYAESNLITSLFREITTKAPDSVNMKILKTVTNLGDKRLHSNALKKEILKWT